MVSRIPVGWRWVWYSIGFAISAVIISINTKVLYDKYCEKRIPAIAYLFVANLIFLAYTILGCINNMMQTPNEAWNDVNTEVAWVVNVILLHTALLILTHLFGIATKI